MNRKEPKTVYFEILRLIAIFGVLFCHTGRSGIHHYLETDNRFNYWFGIFAVSVAQYCIPLFFMITGALLLKRQESISYVLRHRVLRIVCVIVLAALFQYLWRLRGQPGLGFDRKLYFQMVYEGSAAGQHWFLYAYLSFLLILPFLQRLVKVIPARSWFIYLFIIWEIIYGLFPIIAYYQEWGSTPLELSMFGDAVLYSMLGYFVECCTEDFFYKGKNVFWTFIIVSLLVAGTMYMNHTTLDGHYAAYGSALAPVFSFLIYITVRYICCHWRCPVILEKGFLFAGSGVFGVYLMEGPLRETFYFIYLVLNTRIYSYPATFVWIFTCIVTGILITNLLKKVPVIGKLL
ncbi:acyltransferase family protein [Acetatifactor muris]|jgi:surface polysaccharide O-acyltransferase-like enzyme|uniref:Acyltransferase family protein n=1 Tax=Acetatifactor muris TaxID=879566 RepID=A0A2K4ZFD2_9FIRM|nr:acyltransferase family protein [Acetatifactor muris]MCI8800081.1 acyltransferase [Lachnospiraceae bacterium]MCR2047372.1 acyltransferase family protein [Acetatifactor muris]SOY29177.1 Acyltransferase family protein [Acetatifactor muris]